MDTRFCENCGCKTGYDVFCEPFERVIRGVAFSYEDENAVCRECGEPVFVPEVHDANIDRIDAAYRKAAGLITAEEIRCIMEKYDIGANPLSKMLGFGEVTIARYLAGQTPSKGNSEKLLEVAASVAKMEEHLLRAKEAIADVAFKKCEAAICRYKSFNDNPSKIEAVVQYLFNQMTEVTPLALQKLLYFSQGFYAGLNNGKYLFEADCQAWAHGPVYPDIYFKYKEFGYNPIDAAKMSFDRPEINLPLKEQELLDHITKTFGRYSGIVLEQITHLEGPWKEARGNLRDGDRSERIISKESIAKYYTRVAEEYSIETAKDIEKYCNAMCARVWPGSTG